jgi:hypothetical protein
MFTGLPASSTVGSLSLKYFIEFTPTPSVGGLV